MRDVGKSQDREPEEANPVYSSGFCWLRAPLGKAG